MFEVQATPLRDCWEVLPKVHEDARGRFVKTFHGPEFARLGLPTHWQEEYHSLSRRGVLRGMHFQTPPRHHAKAVTCLAGEVLDVVLDLRNGSPSFGQCAAFSLSAARGSILVIPAGCAHGFLTLSDEALLHYKVSTVYAPEHDAGIRWDGFGFSWPVTDPILSDRDRAFPTLDAFASPF